ncbi:LysR family transcriptional regulator [Micromonospora sp. ALFpr18c]|uniref:LysR family transcriptional regulator n=1 Tax=unclassified Micromonospora TaxID=2617518 RepID=UPI00124AEA37|nr:LysR family transcriptional regulator [Micromonospora sp. ALFpr18c]KAB1940735.1 LysR family transcriptional regulator [Micromonospora sp. ALFpr18c]
MELRQLAVFVAVAEELSITRAAARSQVVQSAVSATLRTLERQLGVELVSRTTHRVELTEAGRVLLPEARRVLAAAAEAQHVMQQLRGGLRGTLRIGTMLSEVLIGASPPRVISSFLAAHPSMSVDVRTGGSVEHAEALRRGRLDLAYVALPPEEAAGLTLHPVHAETMVLLVPPDHRLAGRQRVELTELADEPFVDTPPTWGTRVAIDRAFIRAEAARMVSYEIADACGVREFVRHGLGVAIGPSALADPDLVCVPIGRYAPRLVISLATADRDLSTPIRAFLQIAEQLSEAAAEPT